MENKMERKNAISIIFWAVIIIVIAIGNIFVNVISIPDINIITQLEIDFITISTVFIGFAFTSLGILLGLSSEKLIQKIKDTKIIMNKVARIVQSIVFLMISIGISLYFVLGLNVFCSRDLNNLSNMSKVIYVIGLGFLVIGIIYYAGSIYELYDLIKRIYDSNKDPRVIESNNRAKEQMEKVKAKLESADYGE